MAEVYNPAPIEVFGIDRDMRKTQHERWKSLTVVQRCNLPDSWTVEWGPLSPDDRVGWSSDFGDKSTPPTWLAVFLNGDHFVSGFPTDGEQKYSTDAYGRQGYATTANYSGYLGMLWDRHAWPLQPGDTGSGNPTNLIISPNKEVYEPREGVGEDRLVELLRGIGSIPRGDRFGDRYLSGITAKDSRWDRFIEVPASQHRGSSIEATYPALRKLGDVVSEVAERSMLRVSLDYTQFSINATGNTQGGVWRANIAPFRDRSATVRFGMAGDAASGIVTEYSRKFARQTMTLPVAIRHNGSSDSEVRIFNSGFDPSKYNDYNDSLASEIFYGPIIEEIIEGGKASDQDERIKLADDAHERYLEGRAKVDFEFSVKLPPGIEINSGIRPGDIVGVDFLVDAVQGEQQALQTTSVVREITSTWTGTAKPAVELKLGTTNDSLNMISQRSLGVTRRRVEQIARRI